MYTCPNCSTPVRGLEPSCPACGSGLDISDRPTGTAPRPVAPRAPTPSPGGRARTPPGGGTALAGERFVPGTVLADRYRIVGLLGRGGMGEVYRADDLRLEQSVALKFLPHGLDGDVDRLARFYREVRVARQVSHPAVCRVYDVAEADGHLFLSMELVDGENLASLLRRIGRLPPDKALDIARQLSSGLAAAHEKGVLHRDLKPANVMLDGQGKVRITDFGLAGLAESLGREDARSGTPSYMSPEQLHGREVTVRSDIYSLGLVLYELYTGRRAFEAKSFAEYARKHRDERPIEPSALVAGLDPAVERAILACLEKEPRKRPGSSLVVSALLTGNDPLEAAIAAGETPSPELVAAAGEAKMVRPSVAWGLLAAVLAGLVFVPLASRQFQIVDWAPSGKAPLVLEDRARDLLRRLGSAEPAVDEATGLTTDWNYLDRQEKDPSRDRWRPLQQGSPPVLQLWYRRSPRPLVSLLPGGDVYWSKPGLDVTGMAGATYGLGGRLLRFYAIPPQLEGAPRGASAAPVDWSPLFAEAGLDAASFRAVEPRWTPPFYCDGRAAWEGDWVEGGTLPIRVEAASYLGRPVWFEVVWPWSRPERMEKYAWPAGKLAKQATFLGVVALLLGSAAFMARRNLVLGRGDRRGAFRVALVLAALGLVSWALGAHHVGDWGAQVGLVTRGAGAVVLQAAYVWLFYLAVEPYARRIRPWTLVSWTRLLGGGFGDPLVGRDALFGLAWAVGLFFTLPLIRALPPLLGQPPPPPVSGALDTLLGTGALLSEVVGWAGEAILVSMGLLLLFVLARLLLRRDVLAAAAIVGLVLAPSAASAEGGAWALLALSVVWALSWVFLLLRFGLLAALVGLYAYDMLTYVPLTTDVSSWMAGPTLLVLPLLGGLGVLALRNALGGTGLRRYLAGEAPSGA